MLETRLVEKKANTVIKKLSFHQFHRVEAREVFEFYGMRSDRCILFNMINNLFKHIFLGRTVHLFFSRLFTAVLFLMFTRIYGISYPP